MNMNETAARALAEIGAALGCALPGEIEAMAALIRQARRIALYGVGREGLMMKALTMRLYQMGLDAHVVGDMTTPPLESGDLLIASAGPGRFSTVSALISVARGAGAATLCITAEPEGASAAEADHFIYLPAQTMASGEDDAASVLPMGSLYEAVQFLFFEILVLHLRDGLGLSAESMSARHTNLE